MCGRFTQRHSSRAVSAHFEVGETPELRPRFNAAPGQDVTVVRCRSDATRVLESRRWGLIPTWARSPVIGGRLINARSETVANKPAFSAALRARRCLVPADGFYEWGPWEGGRAAYHLEVGEGALFAIAGLFEHWRGPGGEVVDSCTLLTTDANPEVQPIHARMPVILEPGDYAAWLDPVITNPSGLAHLLRPWSGEPLRARPVCDRVNRVAFDDPSCLDPAAPPAQRRLPF